MSWRAGVASVAALALVPLGLNGPAAQADPGGTLPLGTVSVPTMIRLQAGTEAGIAYTTDSAIGGDEKIWLKADGSAPVRPAFPKLPYGFRMAGRMIFGNDFPANTFSYATWDGPVRHCPAYGRGGVQFLPDGWAYVDQATKAVKKVVAGSTGCTVTTFLADTPAVHPRQVAGGDENGLVVDTTLANGTARLAYYKYADPANPVILDRPITFFVREYDQSPTVQAGALLADEPSNSVRIPLDGGKRTTLPLHQGWQAMTKAVVGAATTSAGLQTIPVAGGAIQAKAGVTGGVVADGTYLYSMQGTGEAPGIYRRTSATGAATLVVPLPTAKYPTRQYGVSVSPGRVYYSNGLADPWASNDSYDLMMRITGTGTGKVTLGPEQKLGASFWSALSGSAGWLQYDGNKLRNASGTVTKLPEAASAPPRMSGNRVLLKARGSVTPADTATMALYDIKTRKLVTTWPQGPQDLFGNYFAYAGDDGSIRVKDLSNGKVGLHRPAGSKIAAVAIHGQWMAWVTACPGPAWPCSQTLTIRNTATRVQQTIATRGTGHLVLSGGYLALDVVPGTQREVRTIKLGTTTPSVIGTLPKYASDGMPPDINAAPDQFDLDDETIAWVDANHLGKIAQLAAVIDPPRYLGNAIASTSMSTSWTLQLPVSKALPTCQVTIYYGSTKVRILNCANSTGMVAVHWDGKSGSGGNVTKGKYTYRVTGLDADKYNLRNYNGTLTAVGGSITKTA